MSDSNQMHSSNKHLSQCEDPKLHDLKAKVTFRRLLSDIDSEGGYAQVFEATIGSTAYDLKMFKFHDIEIARDGLLDSENERISDDLLQAHTDPFYNECRAYGRLEEAKLNGEVAIRCHGYHMPPAEIEVQLNCDFKIEDWNRFMTNIENLSLCDSQFRPS